MSGSVTCLKNILNRGEHISAFTVMKLNWKFSFTFLFYILTISVSNSQPLQSDYIKLNLTDPGRKIENSICFNITNSAYENIKTTTGQKVNIKATALVINGDTIEPEEIRTRGKSTLYMRRKSYNFSLRAEASFHHGETSETFKKFYVLSLSMDKNYSSNRLALEMMEASGLFNLFYSFCELQINGNSEGICMVIERPEDWAMKKKDSPLVIRRGFNNEIDKIKTGKKTDKEDTKKYRDNFRQIYRSMHKYEGEELYNNLAGWLDINTYMKWLAFNFFVRNGDYTDEVWFFVDPATEKFGIIPWDYDDLFASAPHERNLESIRALGGKLFFSTEDLLDKKIVNDPYLYRIYLAQFKELMEQLSPDVLKRVFENTYAELHPYYSNYKIISNSKYDLRGETNLSEMESNLQSLYEQLVTHREVYLKYLEDNIF